MYSQYHNGQYLKSFNIVVFSATNKVSSESFSAIIANIKDLLTQLLLYTRVRDALILKCTARDAQYLKSFNIVVFSATNKVSSESFSAIIAKLLDLLTQLLLYTKVSIPMQKEMHFGPTKKLFYLFYIIILMIYHITYTIFSCHFI